MNLIDLKKNIKYRDDSNKPVYYLAVVTNATEGYIEDCFIYESMAFPFVIKVDVLSLRDLGGSESVKNYDFALFICHPDFDLPGLRFLTDESLVGAASKQIIALLKAARANLEVTRIAIYGSPVRYAFTSEGLREGTYDRICKNVSHSMADIIDDEIVPAVLLECNLAVTKLGLEQSIDFTGYYRAQTLFKIDMWREVARRMIGLFAAETGFGKKVLCLDCDNTLWGGVVGELGCSGIKMTVNQGINDIYTDVQRMFKALLDKGVLIALVTKNEIGDIKSVIAYNESFQFSLSDFVAIKAGWGSKAESIRELAGELNLGLSSFIFLDDSDVECDLVRQILPTVEVWQVPKKISDYPKVAQQICQRFEKAQVLDADISKLDAYKSESQRKEAIESGSDLQEAWSNLNLETSVRLNEESDIGRCHQLFQKTNQFNLNIDRISYQAVTNFFLNDEESVLTLDLTDKFGDYGIIGAAVLSRTNNSLFINNFVLSCRALGRGVEGALLEIISQIAVRNDCTQICGQFRSGGRNQQVADLLVANGVNTYSVNNNDFDFSCDACLFLNLNKVVKVNWYE
ncbi:HAD-IIIC family phosphatase [Gammaproteobacteria bacterium]|nr:HAD-IIIC family phosphatase [Gammaproteobacteria bacterium]